MGQSLKGFLREDSDISLQEVHKDWLIPRSVGQERNINIVQLQFSISQSHKTVSSPDSSVILKTEFLLLQLAKWCLSTLKTGLKVGGCSRNA